MTARGVKKGCLIAALVLFSIMGGRAGVVISHSSDTDSVGPKLAIDPSGNVYAAWVEKYSDTTGDVFFSRRDNGSGAWSTPQNVSNSGDVCSAIHDSYQICAIDADSSNRAYLVWIERNVIKIRIYSGGSWDSAFTLASGTSVDHPAVAVDADGNIYVVWWFTNFTVNSRVRINGQWEAAKKVSASGKAGKMPDIAVGGGTVGCAWMDKSSGAYRIGYSRRDKTLNASWSTPVTVYNGSIEHNYCAVGVDPSGVAHVIFTEEPTEGIRTMKYCYKSGSGFSSPLTISNTYTIHYPMMETESTNLYCTWQVGGWGNGQAMHYNVKTSGGWSGDTAVANSSGCTYGDIAVHPDGTIAGVYDDNDGEVYYYESDGGTPPPPPPPPPPPENKPPTANFNIWPSTNPWAPANMQFDGQISSDPDGYLAAWDWVFKSGDDVIATDSGSNIYHQFDSRGSFTVTLTVRDNGGLTDRKTKSFSVLGLYPPLSQAKEWFSDESLFQVRYGYKITWAKNPENDKIASINRYRVYRKSEDEDTWNYLGEVQASGVLEYKDIDLALEDKDILGYSVTAVDTDNHESAVGGTGSGSQGPPPVNNEPDRASGKPKLPIKN